MLELANVTVTKLRTFNYMLHFEITHFEIVVLCKAGKMLSAMQQLKAGPQSCVLVTTYGRL